MTTLALTVCAHIAATHYTPRFCAFEHRFSPFPNLAPNPPSALPYASLVVEVLGRGMGMAPAGYALGLAAGGGNGRYHALVLSGAEVNPPESLLVL